MKRTGFAVLIGMGLLVSTAMAGDMGKIRFELDTISGATGLQNAGGTAGWGSVDPGFVPPLSTLIINYVFDANTVIYGDFYVSTHPALGAFNAGQGYIKTTQIPSRINFLGINEILKAGNMELKVGNFELDYGNWHNMRTAGGKNGSNPLYGNTAIDDLNGIEMGVEVSGKPMKEVKWLVGVSDGVPDEQWVSGRGFGYHGKVEYAANDWNLAFSYLRSQHTNTTGNGSLGAQTGIVKSEFMSQSRMGSPYWAIEDQSAAFKAYAGQIQIGGGIDVTTYQLDFATNALGLKWDINYGYAEDADTDGYKTAANGASSAAVKPSRWTYGMLQGVLPLDANSNNWLAGRLSGGHADMYFGAAQDAVVLRYQLGYGMKLNDNGWQLKVEYVNNQYNNFTVQATGLPNYRNNPSFSGLVVAIFAPIFF